MQQASPVLRARLTGAFYLLTVLTGIFAQGFVSGRLVVFGDPAITANNILQHKSLFQLGFAIYMIEMACNVAITAMFYDLLKPVNKNISLCAAFLSLTGCVVKTFSRVFYIVPLFLLSGAQYLNVFSPQQLQAMALLSLGVNEQGAGIALAFFGFYALLKGYLIIRSAFLPRVLGMLSVLAGVGLLAFVHPSLGYRVFPYIAGFGLLGALAQIIWLIAFGVNEESWLTQAAASETSPTQRPPFISTKIPS